jgi:hypothetical protein
MNATLMSPGQHQSGVDVVAEGQGQVIGGVSGTGSATETQDDSIPNRG